MTVSHELDKLYLYCEAKNTRVLSYEMIEDCCPPDLTAVVFDIMDSCGTGSADKALSTLSRLLSAGEPVARLRTTYRQGSRQSGCPVRRDRHASLSCGEDDKTGQELPHGKANKALYRRGALRFRVQARQHR